MMNLKTSALLGNLTRQSVSRQLLPLSSSKNQVITLSQRGAQPATANSPANPVRSFSSTQANRENNNANANTVHHGQSHFYSTHHLASNHRFQSPLAANFGFHHQQQHPHQHPHQHQVRHNSSNKPVPKHTELSDHAWAAINGQDARAVFPLLHEMRREGFYADAALSSRIVSQFLNLNSPQDAERALTLLMDCHHDHGRTLTLTQKQTYTSLAKEIADHSSDFTQALSLGKLLHRYNMLAHSEIADGTLRTYRHIKTTSGLSTLKNMLNTTDVETLLAMQATLVKSVARYRHLIEILLDAKEMGVVPSREACSKISASFITLGDYAGQLAWDTAVQEIYPGFKPSVPENSRPAAQEQQHHHPSEQQRQHNDQHQHQHQHQNQHQSRSSQHSKPNNNNNNNSNNNNGNNRKNHKHSPNAQGHPRNADPCEPIYRACRMGYAAVALEEISKMINKGQLPSPQAFADTIQVCAKREKERTTNYQELYELAMRSVDTVEDPAQRRTSEYDVFNAMLVANATLGDLPAAKKNYDDIVKLGLFPDATGYATLLIATTTGAIDEAHDALRILEEVKRHNIKPNIFFYNVVIGKLSRGRKIERVLEVYEEMMASNIRPNAITYGTLISACTRVGSEEMARNLFKEMTNSPNYHPRQGPHNAMIQFYVRQKKDREAALHYYQDMVDRKLSPTEHTYTLLIEAFACIEPYNMTEAQHLVQSLKRGHVRACEAHYGVLIYSYGVLHRDVNAAEVMFNNMRASDIVPKGPAYQALIEGYITVNKVNRAVELRNELLASGQPSSAYIENTLIRGFGHTRNIVAAEDIFNAMTDPHEVKAAGSIVKEPSTYHSMVTAYLENQMLDKAQMTLTMMKDQHYPELVVKPVEEEIHAASAGPAHGMFRSEYLHHGTV